MRNEKVLIFICSMPRSGGTLLYQLTREICEQAGLCRGRGFAKESITSGVVKADSCQPWMIERVENGALAFGTYRDFRDIILSTRDFYNRRERIKGIDKKWTIQDVLDYRPEILDSFYCWQEYAIWLKYEPLENLAYAITNVIPRCFRGLSLSPEQKQVIIDKYSLEANIKRIVNQKIPMDAGTGSMLTKWHIGSKPTRWQDTLSEAEIQQIETVGGRWLEEYGYK